LYDNILIETNSYLQLIGVNCKLSVLLSSDETKTQSFSKYLTPANPL
jgi:hypothetical protein